MTLINFKTKSKKKTIFQSKTIMSNNWQMSRLKTTKILTTKLIIVTQMKVKSMPFCKAPMTTRTYKKMNIRGLNSRLDFQTPTKKCLETYFLSQRR